MSDQQIPDAPKWGLVELMGHQKIAGMLTKDTDTFGVTLLRVDVPHVEAPTDRGKALTNKPSYTRYFGGAAIYGITPLTEDTVIEWLTQHYWGHIWRPLQVERIELSEGNPDNDQEDEGESSP